MIAFSSLSVQEHISEVVHYELKRLDQNVTRDSKDLARMEKDRIVLVAHSSYDPDWYAT
jgi:hypothetical protein